MSKSGKVDQKELQQVGKGALIAGAGAALAYLTQWMTGADFGEWTLVAGAVFGVAANALRKYLADNE